MGCGVAGCAVFGGVEEVGHLTGGDVVVVETTVGGGACGEVAVKGAHRLAEERGAVALNGSVGVQLYEQPVGSAFDVDVAFFPKAKAEGRGGIYAGEVGVFDAGEDAEFASAPVEGEGALDEKEFVVALGADGADAGGFTVCVGAGASVFAGVVEGVDGGDLAGAGGAREGEVGVAAGLAEDGEFVGDAAGETAGVGVVECPVAVDESVADFAVGIAGEEADAGETFFSLDEDAAEVVRGVVAMVEVDFGFAAGGVAELRERAADVGVPLFDGIEKSVARRCA